MLFFIPVSPLCAPSNYRTLSPYRSYHLLVSSCLVISGGPEGGMKAKLQLRAVKTDLCTSAVYPDYLDVFSSPGPPPDQELIWMCRTRTTGFILDLRFYTVDILIWWYWFSVSSKQRVRLIRIFFSCKNIKKILKIGTSKGPSLAVLPNQLCLPAVASRGTTVFKSCRQVKCVWLCIFHKKTPPVKALSNHKSRTAVRQTGLQPSDIFHHASKSFFYVIFFIKIDTSRLLSSVLTAWSRIAASSISTISPDHGSRSHRERLNGGIELLRSLELRSLSLGRPYFLPRLSKGTHIRSLEQFVHLCALICSVTPHILRGGANIDANCWLHNTGAEVRWFPRRTEPI